MRTVGPAAGGGGAGRPPGGGGSAPESAPGSAPGSSGIRQASLARIKEFGIAPKRDLGQNFLIDDNILEVILARLECRPDDVALEVGAGLGVLTDSLAGVARHVHAFEVDRSLEAALRATLADRSNVSLHLQDVLKARLEGLEPLPTVCASNLPYSVAGPFIIESLQRLPGVRRYCVMVQREVAERMAAAPGSRVYGVLSVWVQLYAEIRSVRRLARSIFYPQPHVDSSLVVLDRRPAGHTPAYDTSRLRDVIQAAFGQRRKMLVNSLSAGLSVPRAEALAWIEELGLPPDVRAERVEPDQFVRMAERVGPRQGTRLER